MKIKEKADALVLSFKYICSTWEEDADIKCAIKSVEHTIEVLNSVFEKQEGTTDIYPTANAIMEQNQLLTELKSRL